MRTSVDLPDDLGYAAKVRAAELGESLKDFFIRAISHEMGLPINRGTKARVTLPLIKQQRKAGPTVTVTNADIEAAIAQEDLERYGNR